MEDFLMEKIVVRKINTSRRRWYAKSGEPLHNLRYYGYETDEDTSESTRHILHGTILSYYQKKKLSVQDSICQYYDRWSMDIPSIICSLEDYTSQKPFSRLLSVVPFKATFAAIHNLGGGKTHITRYSTVLVGYVEHADRQRGSTNSTASNQNTLLATMQKKLPNYCLWHNLFFWYAVNDTAFFIIITILTLHDTDL